MISDVDVWKTLEIDEVLFELYNCIYFCYQHKVTAGNDIFLCYDVIRVIINILKFIDISQKYL